MDNRSVIDSAMLLRSDAETLCDDLAEIIAKIKRAADELYTDTPPAPYPDTVSLRIVPSGDTAGQTKNADVVCALHETVKSGIFVSREAVIVPRVVG